MLVKAGGTELRSDLGTLIAGVVNATPDSFSDTGAERSVEAARRRVTELLEAGADVIEVGGESNVSNRPAVGPQEEIERIGPVVAAAVEAGATVSVDTYKPEVAAAAVAAGAKIVNDISGDPDPGLVAACAGAGAAIVVVHSDVPPKTSLWDSGLYPDGPDGVVDHVCRRLGEIAERLIGSGFAREAVILDPGPDFAKTPAQTTALLGRLDRVRALGFPLMLAASRKDFIGAITRRRPSERIGGSLAAVAAGLEAGVEIIRAHDVAATRDFIIVWRALHGLDPVDPELRIDPDLRREPQLRSFGGEPPGR